MEKFDPETKKELDMMEKLRKKLLNEGLTDSEKELLD